MQLLSLRISDLLAERPNQVLRFRQPTTSRISRWARDPHNHRLKLFDMIGLAHEVETEFVPLGRVSVAEVLLDATP